MYGSGVARYLGTLASTFPGGPTGWLCFLLPVAPWTTLASLALLGRLPDVNKKLPHILRQRQIEYRPNTISAFESKKRSRAQRRTAKASKEP